MDQWETLNAKLTYEQYKQSIEVENGREASDTKILNGKEAGKASIGIDEDVEASEGTNEAFNTKRAAHYNEFKVVQAMRAKMAAGEVTDDDDE